MLTKSLQSLPNDFLLLLLQFSEEVAENAVVLFLTNKHFYALYQSFNKLWFEKFSEIFPYPYFSKAENYKDKFWKKRYVNSLASEAVNEAAMQRYQKKTSNEEIAVIFDELELNIVHANADTHKTFFNYLIYYAASKKDQPLLDYLFKRLVFDYYGISSLVQLNDLKNNKNFFDLLHHCVLCNQVQFVANLLQRFSLDKRILNVWLETYKAFHYKKMQNWRHSGSPECVGSPLHIACLLGFEELVELLAPKQIAPYDKFYDKLNYKNEKGETAFSLAVKGGHRKLFPLLGELIQRELNEKSGKPLCFAIWNDDKATFDELIKWGFKGDWFDYTIGWSPISLAANKKDPYFLNVFLKQLGINFKNFPQDHGFVFGNVPKKPPVTKKNSSLQREIYFGYINDLTLLNIIKVGNDAFYYEEFGEFPIHTAVLGGHVKIVSFYLDRNESVNAKNFLNETPLILAIKHVKFDLVRLFLEKKANLNHKGYLGNTALHYLVTKWFLYPKEVQECIKTLIQDGASILIRNERSLTNTAEKNFRVLDFLIKMQERDLINLACDVATPADALIIRKELKKLKQESDFYDSEEPTAEQSSEGSSRRATEENENSSSFKLNVSMTVLGLFTSVLGAVALSIALTVLIASTGGVALAVIGVVSTAVGAGFFAAGVYRLCKEFYENTEENWHQAQPNY